MDSSDYPDNNDSPLACEMDNTINITEEDSLLSDDNMSDDNLFILFCDCDEFNEDEPQGYCPGCGQFIENCECDE